MATAAPSYNVLPLSDPNSGSQSFDQALKLTTPSDTFSPTTQKILDYIKSSSAEAKASGVAEAQGLAARRGISGSSIEQFGVGQAVKNADLNQQNATNDVMLKQEEQNNQLRQLQAQFQFQRSVYGDELAFQNYQLQLQQILGQQGIDVARDNINASKDIAKQTSQYGLLGAGLSAGAPYFLNSLFSKPGQPGTDGATTPMGTGSFGSGGFNPLNLYNPGSSYAAGAPGTPPAGGFNPMGFLGMAGLAAGGTAAYMNLPKSGLISKATIAPLVNPISTISTVSKAVKSVFRF